MRLARLDGQLYYTGIERLSYRYTRRCHSIASGQNTLEGYAYSHLRQFAAPHRHFCRPVRRLVAPGR